MELLVERLVESLFRSSVETSRALSPFRVERVSGGGNNQAYQVVTPTDKFFLKLYHQDPEDPRFRGKTEFHFLHTLWKTGVRCIPEALGFHESSGCSAGLYSFITGKGFAPGSVTEEMVKAAAQFVVRVNSVRRDPETLSISAASEACFSLKEHWETVARRVSSLKNLDPRLGPVYEEANSFVKTKLVPAWDTLSKEIPSGFEKVLLQSERVLSPSDFGFHNAIQTPDQKIYFIDFEYAGWDDPAKLVCDFFNQVSVPVSRQYTGSFLNSLDGLLEDSLELRKRVEILMPIYQIKWVCILLNHFLPSGARRKKFALQDPSQWEVLLATQLKKAQDLVQHWPNLNFPNQEGFLRS